MRSAAEEKMDQADRLERVDGDYLNRGARNAGPWRTAGQPRSARP
jgi:hypothetical protein